MKHTVHVTVEVDVEIDDAKFTPQVMADFSKVISHMDEIDEHIKHLAYCAIFSPPTCSGELEGYGGLSDVGVRLFAPLFVDAEIQ